MLVIHSASADVKKGRFRSRTRIPLASSEGSWRPDPTDSSVRASRTTQLRPSVQEQKLSFWKRLTTPKPPIDTTFYLDTNNRYLRAPLGIYVDPLTCIDNFNVGWKFGVELPLGRNYGMQIGGIFPDGSWQGYGARVSFRRYLRPELPYTPSRRQLRGKTSPLDVVAVRPYFALDLTWREASYTESDSLRRGGQMLTYGVEKTVYTAAAIYGYLLALRCGIGLQGYIGFGLRIKDARNSLTQAQEADLYHWHEGDVDRNAGANTSFATLWPVLPFGFRLTYRIR